MAIAMSQYRSENLRALVDMGSNGIRFSISSLQSPTQRIMPTLYQNRVGISLYDAQYTASGERVPIDNETISSVVSAYKQFKRTCHDFGVLPEHITVLATEATRTALNSEEFRKQIKDHVGWDVTMLPKEEEGRVGAMGVASSLPEVSGLVMDLGGGSTQLSWLIKERDQADVQMPESGAVSMPYGAAAMSRRLADAEKNETTEQFRQEIMDAVKKAYASLRVPSALEERARSSGGFTLYLSGGGFRGWGYVLMSQHRVTPYPIPVINGFKVSRQEFLNTSRVKAAAAASLGDDEDEDIFRVSDRRAGQVPAVAFLVNVLAEALPEIKEVRFCQGGVREGYLFSSLSAEVKAQHPLVVATQPFDTPATSAPLLDLLQAAFPADSTKSSVDDYKSVFTTDLLDTFANLVYYHASYSKDLQATAALRSTTSGILGHVHGITHESRTLIALMLCARWGGKIPPSDESFKQNLEQLIESPWILWWINYIGAVAALIASVYPAGVGRDTQRLGLNAGWDRDDKQRTVLALRVTISQDVEIDVLSAEARDIEKVGKKKRWIGGKEGAGHRIAVEVDSL